VREGDDGNDDEDMSAQRRYTLLEGGDQDLPGGGDALLASTAARKPSSASSMSPSSDWRSGVHAPRRHTSPLLRYESSPLSADSSSSISSFLEKPASDAYNRIDAAAAAAETEADNADTAGMTDGLRRSSSAALPAIAEEAQELILNAMDLVEDGWDERAYEDVIPLEVKLTIEEAVFGWSHLISSILGHTLFTLAAFAAVYYACRTVLPSYVYLKWILAAGAAVSSFRMVRRRRKVWFRAPYGSAKYRQDAERRLREVKEADARTWLGRIRKLRSQRKVQKQLKRAETNFMVHHQRRRLDHQQSATSLGEREARSPLKHRRRPSFQTDPIPSMQSIQHDQILFANGPIRRLLYAHGGYFGAAPFLLNNPHWISILRHLMPDVYIEISRRVHKSPQHRLIHWAENNPVVAAYGTAQALENSTFDTNGATPSDSSSVASSPPPPPPNIEWDVFLDPHMVESVSIVLRERERFLLSVDPDFYQRRAASPSNGAVNGTAQLKPMEPIAIPAHVSISSSQQDILRYYNSILKKRVRQLVDKMLIAHGNLTQLVLEQTGYGKQYVYSRVRRTRRTLGGGIYARQWMAVFAESLRIGVLQEDDGTSTSSPTRAKSVAASSPEASALYNFDSDVMSCPDTTIARSVEIVQAVSKCRDAFGLVLDLKSRNVPKQVLACVIDALRMDGVRVEGIGSFASEEIRGVSRYTMNPVREIILFHSAGDMQQACHDGTIRPGDSVLFNGGSLIWSPSSLFPLRSCFSQYDAHRVKRSYRLYPFAHVTSRNRHSVSSGSIASTASSASFAEDGPGGFAGNEATSTLSNPMVTSSSTIEQYQRCYGLSIGLYVQEFAIDEAAVNLLVDHVNDNPTVYELGLNWGGVNGITIRGIQPDRFTCTDGYWNQRHIGKDWDSSLSPPAAATSPGCEADRPRFT
jgi:hypothetical protein